MLCGRPVTLPTPYADKIVACGQCLSCRINKRRKWTARILLEAASCAQSIFVTLTYDETNVPKAVCGEALQDVLQPRDFTHFIKRLRKNGRMGKIRYFGCGEYGEKTQRPHYHLVLFGKHCNPANELLIRETWGMGHITISELNATRAAYVASYTVKKMTKSDDKRLNERPPEFTHMSRKPGIGHCAVEYLASLYYRRDGCKALADKGDVQSTVRIQGKIYPLDTFMLTKIRERLDIPRLQSDRLTNTNDEVFPDYGKAAQTLRHLEISLSTPHGSL